MKVLSYNIYCVKDNIEGIPSWETRQKNLKINLDKVLKTEDIDICCFQEVNENNINVLTKTLVDNNYKILPKFPMKTSHVNQYNLTAVKESLNLNYTYCLPHGKSDEYKNIENQVIDYNMSDYRTTLFCSVSDENNSYLIGNIHTDYISVEGKIKGVIKSLDFLDKKKEDYKLIIGDMNMICHMSEAYCILKEKNNYQIISRNKNFDISDNSWHGYGLKEQANVDFAFIEKDKINNYNYRIIKEYNILNEASDHRMIIIDIN